MTYDETYDPETGLTAWRASGRGLVTVLPDAEADLMWWRDGLWIAGIDTTHHTFEESPGGTTYGVRLPAGTIAPILRDSATLAVDERLKLSSVLAAPTESRLRDFVDAAPDKRAAVSSVATLLLREAQVDLGTRRACLMLVEASARAVPVAEIARQFGWSSRRLHRFCSQNFGVSPVTLRQLLRFRRARRLLTGGTAPAETAAIAGYSDQAHLTREVARFAGVTPRRLHICSLN